MARKPRVSWSKIPKDIMGIIDKSEKSSANVMLNRLVKSNVKPVISIGELKRLAVIKSKRDKVPIKVTRNFPIGHKYSGGIALHIGRKVNVKIHPVLRYYDKRYINDVIEHELDHARINRKVKRSKKYI